MDDAERAEQVAAHRGRPGFLEGLRAAMAQYRRRSVPGERKRKGRAPGLGEPNPYPPGTPAHDAWGWGRVAFWAGERIP